MAADRPTTLRLRISLLESDPEIWRTVDVDGALRLDELHEVIQIIMGWRTTHMHQFTEANPIEYPHPRSPIGRAPLVWIMDQAEDFDGLPESEWTIAQAMTEVNGPLYYEYDFGDSWVHSIELIEESPVAYGARAVVVRGEGRGPFEDAGGAWGYREKLDALADAAHPDHDTLTSWVDQVIGPWAEPNPDTFHLEHVNRELALRFDQAADATGELPADTPRAVDTLLERMPAPFQREFRGYLDRIGVLTVPDIAPEDAARMVEPFAWLIRRVGSDGIILTQAGWLPPTVVSDAMRELGWEDRWIGKMNREDQTAPIADLRADAQDFGLVRKLKGRLVLGTAAKKLLDDPIGLWWHLAGRMVYRLRDEADQHAMILLAIELASGRHRSREETLKPIAFGLHALGWELTGGEYITPRHVDAMVFDSWSTLQSLDVFERNGFRTGPVTPGGRAFAAAILSA